MKTKVKEIFFEKHPHSGYYKRFHQDGFAKQLSFFPDEFKIVFCAMTTQSGKDLIILIGREKQRGGRPAYESVFQKMGPGNRYGVGPIDQVDSENEKSYQGILICFSDDYNCARLIL